MPPSIVRIIEKKRNKESLSKEEIQFFIQKVTHNEIPDYQTTALLMAIFLNGMNTNEIADLTKAMAESGLQIHLDHIPGIKADKHSTGGIGDKVSLILSPLAAACGLVVPMMAGRGLGFSGGTLDKLEAIPGFNVKLSEEKVQSILKEIGCVIIGQTKDIAPADKKLYALRDVTATVESIPLITGSILSKKIAEGTKNLVMDIKVGKGAFMKNIKEATALSKMLVGVGKKSGLHVRCVLTNMDQPLGYAAGNTLEVLECIEILKNQKPQKSNLQSNDLKELTLWLCAHMLHLSKKAISLKSGYLLAQKKLHSGEAYERFKKMIALQGGNLDLFLSQPHRTKNHTPIYSKKSGFLKSFTLDEIGYLIVDLGGGRKKASDEIDYNVGIHFHKKIGDPVKKGEPLCTVFWNTPVAKLEEKLISFFQIGSKKIKKQKLIYKVISL